MCLQNINYWLIDKLLVCSAEKRLVVRQILMHPLAASASS